MTLGYALVLLNKVELAVIFGVKVTYMYVLLMYVGDLENWCKHLTVGNVFWCGSARFWYM